MTEVKQKHLLGIKGMNANQLETIFQTADNFLELLQSPVKKNSGSEGCHYS